MDSGFLSKVQIRKRLTLSYKKLKIFALPKTPIVLKGK